MILLQTPGLGTIINDEFVLVERKALVHFPRRTSRLTMPRALPTRRSIFAIPPEAWSN